MSTSNASIVSAISGKLLTSHVRSQPSTGSSAHRFGGPDTYVAVTAAPQGTPVPYTLRRDVLANRGIELIYCGEGYSKNSGSRSMLGQAYARAQQILATH